MSNYQNIIDLFSNKQLVTLFSNIKDGIVTIDQTGKYIVKDDIKINNNINNSNYVYIILNDDNTGNELNPNISMYISSWDFKCIYPIVYNEDNELVIKFKKTIENNENMSESSLLNKIDNLVSVIENLSNKVEHIDNFCRYKFSDYDMFDTDGINDDSYSYNAYSYDSYSYNDDEYYEIISEDAYAYDTYSYSII